MTTKEILDKLECVTGSGPQYMARCPAHKDNRPSLSIKAVKGKTLVNCFANCEPVEIMNAIGLKVKDLYQD